MTDETREQLNEIAAELQAITDRLHGVLMRERSNLCDRVRAEATARGPLGDGLVGAFPDGPLPEERHYENNTERGD